MTTPKRGGRCGCRGCGLVLLLLLAMAVVWAAVVPFRLLQRVGLQKSPTQRLLSGAPDREAVGVLEDRLRAAGTDTAGVQVQVLELGNTGERAAFAVIDASKGFDLESLDSGETEDTLSGFAALTDGLDIDRIAIYYVDEDGKPLFTITHRVDAIVALEQNAISETEFLEGLGVNFDLSLLREGVGQ